MPALNLPEDCPAHANLADNMREIRKIVEGIRDRLGDGDVTLATLGLRVQFLEKLVYGAVAVALLGLATGILTLVLKG